MDSADSIFWYDLLDTLECDVPKEIWTIKSDINREVTTLRTFLWPGFLNYQFIDTEVFGYAYFGDGVKNVDVGLFL